MTVPLSSDDALAALRLLREEVDGLATSIPGTVSRVSLRVGDIEIGIDWATQAAPAVPVAVPAAVAVAPAAAAPAVATAVVAEAAEPEADDDVRTVAAPLVGTFYAASEPGADPFVRLGDRLEPGQTVGIVEAMKLMNQVASDWAGEVVEVLVKNGEPVEFGQELVRIRVDG